MVHNNALNEDIQDELGDPRLEKLWHKVPLAFSPFELEPTAYRVKMWDCGGALSLSMGHDLCCPSWSTGTSPLLLAVRTAGIRQALHSVWLNPAGVWSGCCLSLVLARGPAFLCLVRKGALLVWGRWAVVGPGPSLLWV